MSALGRVVTRVRAIRLREVPRLAFRKLVYRDVRMGRYGTLARDAVAPGKPCAFAIEIWGPERYGEVVGTSEYLTEDDLADFRRQDSKCIVVLDGDRIAASSWMTRGQVYVHELHRRIDVSGDTHFSCRSYVSPDYRGHSLLSHMIHTYTAALPPDHEVWGLVYYWNAASVKSLANIGWDLSGEYSTTWWFGRKRPGERRIPARPAFDGDVVHVP